MARKKTGAIVDDRRWKIGAEITITAAGLIGVPSAIGYFVDKFQEPLTQALITSAEDGATLEQGSYLIDYWFLFGVATLVAAVILLGYWIFKGLGDARIRIAEAQSRTAEAEAARAAHQRETETARAEISRRSNYEAKTAYDHLTRSIRRVLFNSYNPVDASLEPPPCFHFENISCIFDISSDGDARVTQDYSVRAAGESARFWTLRLDSDPYAIPFETLRSIDFDVIAVDQGHEVVALPIDNEGLNRSVALVFLPELQPGETFRFRIAFNWPKWFGEFIEKNATDWSWSYRSLETAPPCHVTYRFKFASDIQHVLAENKSAQVSGERLEPLLEGSGNGWLYRSENHPGAKLRWHLRFQKS